MSTDELRKYKIVGGQKLSGEIQIYGAKNAVSKQLVASILTDEKCVFHNVPDILEIHVVLDMLSELGAEFEWKENTVTIQTKKIKSNRLSTEYSGKNRIPVLFLGAMLHRNGEVSVPRVGGCNIGARPIDFHLDGLRRMGAEITEDKELITAKVDKKLKGCDIHLSYPSVGTTENLIFAGVLAEGTTVITNAAIESEILDTILVLQRMGARIFVDVDRRIIIDGVSSLRGVEHHVIPDRMEAAGLASLALATDSKIKVLSAKQEDMITFLNAFRELGGEFDIKSDGITFFRGENGLVATQIETDVHPGFMTDWQQPFTVAMTQAEGASVVHETVYESRFGYTQTLNEMGAKISLSHKCLGSKTCRYDGKNHLHSAILIGPTKLKSMDITIPDLRAGFAYLIAALVAEGVSTIDGVYHLERGHARLVERLNRLGAKIEIV